MTTTQQPETRARRRTKGDGPRLRDAMPRPLLVLFVLGGLAAFGATVLLIVTPPSFDPLSVADRRPPPAGSFSHRAGSVGPAPMPIGTTATTFACPGVGDVRLLAGPAGLARLRQVLGQTCGYARGVPAELQTAVRGLEGATVRFGIFELSGVESTADAATRTIWLNAKFAAQKTEFTHVIPVLVHEAWHLARAHEAVTAEEELRARAAEVQACRRAIPLDAWPRWCKDAQALTDLPRAEALRALVEAGYQS